MSLLKDIQTATIDASSDLGTLLRKCKLLAAHLGNQQLENWLVWESNGYPENVPVPGYRVWPLQVKGNFSGPFGSGVRNAPIPTVLLPENVQESYNKYECRISIASIESLVEKNESGIIALDTSDLSLALGTNVFQNQNCLECWAEFGIARFVDVLNTVRDRVLDFSLAIWKEYPNAGETNSNAQEFPSEDKITQIFNTTVYGGAANLVGTANDSSVAFNIKSNDFESVRRVLQDNGVAEEDIEELKNALAADQPPQSPGQFGPKVSDWIASMIKKASEGTWGIGIAAGGNLLAQILSKFYGI